MMRKIFILVLCLIIPFLSCTRKSSVAESETKGLSFTVSIAPQAYILKRIVGEDVKVNVMVPQNANPETYEPGPKKMMDIKDSRIYFAIGMPFEKALLKRVKDQFPSVIHSEMHRNIPLRYFDGHEHDHDCDGHHHHHHHHHHGNHDPHIWVDPVMLIQMAQNTVTELLKIDNINREKYIKNHIAFKQELQQLHDETLRLFKDSGGKSFVVYHPAWGYFADRYGLKQVAIEVDGKEPSASEMAQMVNFIKEKDVKKIFVQKQFSDNVVKSLSEETGIEAVMIDPLEENVIESIRKSAELIKEGLVK